MTRPIVGIILVLLWAALGDAANLQYDVTTLHIIGTFEHEDDARPLAGTALLEVPGPVASIVWPVPSGCPAGRKEWSKLSPGAVLPILVIPELVFFHTTSTLYTGCRPVASWRELKNAYRGIVVLAMSPNDYDFLQVLDDINVIVSRRCPGTAGGANCDTARANMLTMDAEYPGAAAIANFTTQLVILRTDVRNLKNAQCTAGNTPFC